MAYQTYTTEALVCGSRDSYTSDRSYLLLTEAAGMLFATAKSVREERSRQRYALQDFSLIRVSLVKGRSGWRVGSVESRENVFASAAGREARGAIVRIVKLLRRYLQGEEASPLIFADAKKALFYLQPDSSVPASRVVDLFTLKLLYQLGYVESRAGYEEQLKSGEWPLSIDLPPAAYAAINQAEKVSHL